MNAVAPISESDIRLKDTYLERLCRGTEREIRDKTADYYTKYFAVYHLQTLARKNPTVIDQVTIDTLTELLKDRAFSEQRQSLFLFRLAAETLCNLVVHAHGHTISDTALGALKDILRCTSGHAHRATAEALSSLPFSMNRPALTLPETIPGNVLSWNRLLSHLSIRDTCPPRFMGRSLVSELRGGHRLLVIKFAKTDACLEGLSRESFWLDHLRSDDYAFPIRFVIPEPVKIKNNHLFRLIGLTRSIGMNLPPGIHPDGHAIAFLSDPAYYSYPNHNGSSDPLDHKAFAEVMGRNAWLLGRLSGSGIIHTAPIPLFHNRVQTQRRRDRGLYEWFRAGRLDRWLQSCAYPNLGVTGIRDLEHLEIFKGSNLQLYRMIGNHFLSMFLIAGSYFRNKQKDRIGWDDRGNPLDVRYLFDKAGIKEIIDRIFANYYQGFTNSAFAGELPVDTDNLADRMIDEMGIDRYMEEILRIADQEAMSDEAFVSFLSERGMTDEDIRTVQRGKDDINLMTGPHLGEFNRPISLPELIECVGTMSALCMAGRYLNEKREAALI